MGAFKRKPAGLGRVSEHVERLGALYGQGHSTPANADLLLSRLEGVKSAGKGWRARCPVHGGRSESLSITEGGTGYVLVHCHAGCTTAAIVEAVGLRLADLCPARERGWSRPLVHVDVEALIANANRRRVAEELERHKAAAIVACGRWDTATEPSPCHPYLRAKNVEAHGIRQDRGLLLVPLRDGDGVLWNVQSIAANGDKRFMPGARMQGLWHMLGGPVGDMLCIAEGYATAATIHAAMGGPVAVAFNAGNLKPVALALRALYPAARIVLCADDDAETSKRIGRNPGMDAAEDAARAVGGTVARPRFGGEL